MPFYLEKSARRWINGINNPEAPLRFELTRRDQPSIPIAFVERFVSAYIELDALPSVMSSFRFGAKPDLDFAGDYMVSNYDEEEEVFVVVKTEARIIADAVTTDASATLTSETAGFSSVDVGRAITGAGIPDATTILSVQSATSVTLSANATATAVGVTISIPARQPVYTVQPILSGEDLGDAFVNGTIAETVADQAARYALVDLEAGTIVKQSDGPSYWIVIDADQLDNAAGWDFAPELEYLDLKLEIEWIVDGVVTSSIPIALRVYNDYNRGTEGVPLATNPSYPSPAEILTKSGTARGAINADTLTGFAGGAATDLDGLATAADALAVGALVQMVATAEGVLSAWRLTSGTDAEDVAAGIVRPDDYAGGTNEKVWIRVF